MVSQDRTLSKIWVAQWAAICIHKSAGGRRSLSGHSPGTVLGCTRPTVFPRDARPRAPFAMREGRTREREKRGTIEGHVIQPRGALLRGHLGTVDVHMYVCTFGPESYMCRAHSRMWPVIELFNFSRHPRRACLLSPAVSTNYLATESPRAKCPKSAARPPPLVIQRPLPSASMTPLILQWSPGRKSLQRKMACLSVAMSMWQIKLNWSNCVNKNFEDYPKNSMNIFQMNTDGLGLHVNYIVTFVGLLLLTMLETNMDISRRSFSCYPLIAQVLIDFVNAETRCV